ncbi:hypothetical protein EUZ85_07985 [Hahella sp. KA22]|uniref:hypothetical protein n=1 Tax=Hahella sp. KA22 TaxID=1628392 RepID=UPI000FDDCD1F|nr:hypothetical protein [Hahella sp. KA22]AZZ90660.1 hypothetical protein ENC22_05435 [Hahella sp. KA22]QAY54030.1 hypothetical protein EUZ85_07985 [Hahella sp. KA22]
MEKIIVKAEFIEAIEEEFTPDFKVVGIYFGEGDPENSGQHWNFTQSIGDDDDDDEGVCTVKEVQQATVYGGITEFTMDCRGLVCKFDESACQQTGVNELEIQYNLNHKKWDELCTMAKRVFVGAPYFTVNEVFKP